MILSGALPEISTEPVPEESSAPTLAPEETTQTQSVTIQPSEPAQEPEPPVSMLQRLALPLLLLAVTVVAVIAVFLHKKKRKAPVISEMTPTVKPEEGPPILIGNLHHVGRREEQQDSFCISDVRVEQDLAQKGLMAVVADGMGGLDSGGVISQMVTDTFLHNYRAVQTAQPEAFLLDGVHAAQNAVRQYMDRTDCDGGSTLVAVMLKQGFLSYISVGDSRIYLLRQGVLTQLNHEHTYGAMLLERARRGEIDMDEVYSNPMRNALTAYIGMQELHKVDRSETPIPLQRGDTIVLCSDGIFNALGDEALVAALQNEPFCAAELLETAVLGQNIPNQDNLTAVILQWRG